MNISELFNKSWPYLLTLTTFLAILATAVHILYKKRDTRAAAGWLGLVWFAPVLGVCLYWMFGVNRIKRRAMLHFAHKQAVSLPKSEAAVLSQYIEKMCGDKRKSSLAQLSRMTDKLTRQPLMQGNRITPLLNGDQAFPRMLASIEAAQYTITMCSYIFDNDAWGKRFRTAMKKA
ncbi:MAG: PLDc N-terminal domain-containing protein, partial [Desulfobulbales bacterium]|nr:PLDc N-terminal domain-containing protein [Desulfobulbales bacterium]